MRRSEKSLSVSLDQLIAFNQEITALAAAGIPLETSLAELARDLPGRAGQFTHRIADRLARGVRLDQAIAAEGDALPQVYQAMVAAGLRSGQLPAALHALTETAQRIAATRRMIGMAVIHPLVVCVVAWLLLGLTVAFILPSFQWLDLAQRSFVSILTAMKTGAAWWVPAGPVVMILLALFAWYVSGRARAIDLSGRAERRIGGRGTILRLGHAATYADILALLMEQATPLDEALQLAAHTANVPGWRQASALLAEAIREGQPITAHPEPLRQLPALVRLALLQTGRPDPIVHGLRAAAETYRDRARRRARWLALVLPILLTVVLGGGVVLAYTITVFGPYIAALYELSN